MNRTGLPLPWTGLIVALALLLQQAIALVYGEGPAFALALWQVGVMALGIASLALVLMPPRRIAFALGFLICAALLAWAFWLEHIEGLDPCPLCMFQRVAFAAIGLIFLVGTFHNPGRIGSWIYALLLVAVAGVGAALAARQVWLQSLPANEVPACGMGLSYMLESMPFLDVITRVLEGSGECADKGWVFLGLSIAGWTLAFFVAIAVAGIALARRD
ncbi:Disulfide bond formation protein B [Burkholderiales bacterium]|nr:Disulfide bond formation protein B [Burkholderiales bacterium]